MSGGAAGFFFSSRRRHTRYIGDWRSDVCSSDLPTNRIHFSCRSMRVNPIGKIACEVAFKSRIWRVQTSQQDLDGLQRRLAINVGAQRKSNTKDRKSVV